MAAVTILSNSACSPVENDTLKLKSGTYLALLSHSGSRGTGAQVASYYSKLARERHSELPRELSHLAWLDMDKEEGQEYWQAMELMGKYAAANHACIHRHIAENLHAQILLDLENHHNYAWKEKHLGQECNRSSQRGNSGWCWRDRDYSRIHGESGLYCSRKRKSGILEFLLPWCR